VNGAGYAERYGPGTGDRVVLGDTGLVVEVEQDAQAPGQELLVGFARNARNGI
jgi:urease subunit alpha